MDGWRTDGKGRLEGRREESAATAVHWDVKALLLSSSYPPPYLILSHCLSPCSVGEKRICVTLQELLKIFDISFKAQRLPPSFILCADLPSDRPTDPHLVPSLPSSRISILIQSQRHPKEIGGSFHLRPPTSLPFLFPHRNVPHGSPANKLLKYYTGSIQRKGGRGGNSGWEPTLRTFAVCESKVGSFEKRRGRPAAAGLSVLPPFGISPSPSICVHT